MARPTLKVTWIPDPKARKIACKKRMHGLMKKADELTILCNASACLVFFSRDDNKLVAWPSQEVAKSLIDRFYSLRDIDRNVKSEDQESFIKNKTKKIEKKLADSQKVIAELEMQHLMLQLQNGRPIVDLSENEIENLMSYASKKIAGKTRELGYTEHPYAGVNKPYQGDETPRASEVASERVPCFSPRGRGSMYLMDQWFSVDPNVQNYGDGTHLTKTEPRFNLNLEPSDDDEDMETYEGESSKSGAADDA